MSLNFVSIDFEIAAPQWDTVCSVAMVRVRDGRIVDEYSTLVNPKCEFGRMQMHVHGITPQKVEGAPEFRDIAAEVVAFIGSDILISHNIPFDGNVLYRALVKSGVPVPTIPTLCTLACSNIYIPYLDNHKLPTVCGEFGVKMGRHHDALADTRACAEIMIAMARKMEADSLDDVMAALHLNCGEISQEYVFPPRMSNGNPVYIGSDTAARAGNPFAIQEGLRTLCPDIANEITLDQLKDGRTMAFKVSGAILLYLVIGANSTYMKVPDLADPLVITPHASQYKDGSWKLNVSSMFDYDAFIRLMADRCKELYDNNASESFGCCSSFIQCSDAMQCIKAGDPFYRGCAYRRNLEAGRIFYGKNQNV